MAVEASVGALTKRWGCAGSGTMAKWMEPALAFPTQDQVTVGWGRPSATHWKRTDWPGSCRGKELEFYEMANQPTTSVPVFFSPAAISGSRMRKVMANGMCLRPVTTS